MSDAKKFRDRAADCRSLAANARTEADRAMLGDIADELDAEAERIDKKRLPSMGRPTAPKYKSRRRTLSPLPASPTGANR